MDFREEKLSIITILFVIGISSLLFTLVMILLDGVIIRFFLQCGVLCLVAGILLFITKRICRYLYPGKTQRKYHQ